MPRPIIDVQKRHKATPSSIFFTHKAYAVTRKPSTLRWPSTVSKLSSWQSTAGSDQKQSWAPICSEKKDQYGHSIQERIANPGYEYSKGSPYAAVARSCLARACSDARHLASQVCNSILSCLSEELHDPPVLYQRPLKESGRPFQPKWP